MEVINQLLEEPGLKQLITSIKKIPIVIGSSDKKIFTEEEVAKKLDIGKIISVQGIKLI